MSKITEEIEKYRKRNLISQANVAKVLGMTDKTYVKKVHEDGDFDFMKVIDLIKFFDGFPHTDEITDKEYPLMYRQKLLFEMGAIGNDTAEQSVNDDDIEFLQLFKDYAPAKYLDKVKKDLEDFKKQIDGSN